MRRAERDLPRRLGAGEDRRLRARVWCAAGVPQIEARANVQRPVAHGGAAGAASSALRRGREAAGPLEPSALGTLAAIPLAPALVVREALDGLVTYDRRLAAAAERLDLEVLAPS